MRASITIARTKQPEYVGLDFVLSHDGIYALDAYEREARIVTTTIGVQAVTVIFYQGSMQPLNTSVHKESLFIRLDETMSVTFAPTT